MMAESNSLLMQNTNVKDKSAEKFPDKILNDLAKKLKATEDKIIQERNLHKAEIAIMMAEQESNRYERAQSDPVSIQVQTEVPRDASKDALVGDINKLKQEVSKLVYEKNRYHLSISYCTVRTSDDEFSNSSLSDEVSIKASTPVTTSLGTLEPSILPVQCSSVSSSDAPALSSTVPALMPSSVVKKGYAETKMKTKDKTFISRIVMTLIRLETKYLMPEHKRKKRLFTRKDKNNPIVPSSQKV